MALHDWTKALLIALILSGPTSPLCAGVEDPRSDDQRLLEQILVFLPGDKQPSVPVRFVDPRQMGKTTDPGAFTLDNVPVIYVSNQTAAFDLARRGDRHARAVLASCIWHEEQHVRGHGEMDAYDAQIEMVMLFIRTDRMASARGEALVSALRQLRTRAAAQVVAAK